MKIGSFVSCGNKPLTDKEIKAFDDAIRDAFEEYGFIVSEPVSFGEDPMNPEYPNARFRYLGIKTLWVVTPEHTIIGRNGGGDRIKFLSLSVNVSNRFDKDKNEQYELWIIGNGVLLPYKCSEARPISPDGHFQYGTEVEDFNFYVPAHWLYRKTHLEKSTPGQFKKIIEAFAKVERRTPAPIDYINPKNG